MTESSAWSVLQDFRSALLTHSLYAEGRAYISSSDLYEMLDKAIQTVTDEEREHAHKLTNRKKP